MQMQAISLSEAEQRAVAVFLRRQTVRPGHAPVVANNCTASPAMRAPATSRRVERLGRNGRQHALQKNGGLTAADLPKLKLKWAFGYHRRQRPRARSRRSPAAACSSPARTAKCTRSTRRPAARTGPSRRRPACAPGCRSAPTRTPAGLGPGRVLRRRARQRLRGGRAAPASRSGSARLTSTGGGDHRRAHLLRRPGVRAGAGTERGRPGRHRRIPVLHVPRQPLGARREHRRRCCGRPTPSTSPSRAARTRTASRCGDRPAAASGRRRRSMRSAAWSTSPPATATPIRRRR